MDASRPCLACCSLVRPRRRLVRRRRRCPRSRDRREIPAYRKPRSGAWPVQCISAGLSTVTGSRSSFLYGAIYCKWSCSWLLSVLVPGLASDIEDSAPRTVDLSVSDTASDSHDACQVMPWFVQLVEGASARKLYYIWRFILATAHIHPPIIPCMGQAVGWLWGDRVGRLR
jgi:hypothetical protein